MRIYDLNNIKEIVFELHNEKAVVIETDTVMGILCFNKQTIYKIKKRNHSKKIVLFVDHIERIPNLANSEKKVLETFWPGPLTIIKNKISYRIPKHPQLLQIIQLTGPIYCSSANISGKEVVKDWEEAVNIFKKSKEIVSVVRGKSLKNRPSTIYDLDKRKFIRIGEISEEEIVKSLK